MSHRIPWLVAMLAVATSAPRVLAQPFAEIACGETQVRLLGPGPDELRFFAQPGEVVSVAVVPLLPLPGFVPRWRIYDGEGRRVQLSSGSHRCVGRCETERLPGGGSFALRVSDSGVGVGAYVVSLEAISAMANGVSNGPPTPVCGRTENGAPEGTRAIVFGQSLSGTIDRPGETDTFTVLVLPIGLLGIELTRTGGEEAFAPVWDAFDVLGRRIGHGVAGEPVSLLATGIVTILVADAEATATGTYVLSVGPGLPTNTTITTSTTTSTRDGEATTSTIETTTTVDSTSTTSSTEPPVTTTTTTLPPVFDLNVAIEEPPLGPRGMLGRTLAAGNGRLLIGAPHEDVGDEVMRVYDAGAVLVVDVEGPVGTATFGQVLARITRLPAPGAGDLFGAAVAAAGAGVVVGAPGARAAFVFENAQDKDMLPTTIVPPVDGGADGFGESVAVVGDLVVVGAPSSAGRAGVAYVFERATGVPHAVLAAPEPVVGARLGASMASSDTRVLIGAPGNAEVPGRAFLFDPKTGALVQTFESETPVPGNEFGTSVAFAGDDVVIGAPGVDEGRGRVERFAPAGVAPERTFVSPVSAPGERFGAAIAVEDDLLAVGAPGAARDGVTAGAVYLFDVLTGMPEDALEKGMPQADDGFGAAVAIEGGRVFSGAPGDDTGTTDGGTTFVFEEGEMVAALRERLSRSGFGEALAGAGSVFYAAAPDGVAGRGFVARIEADTDDQILVSPSAEPARFGASIAAIGPTVVIGAPATSGAGGERVGAVHVFDELDGRPPRLTIGIPDGQAGDQFGFAVGAVDGDLLASAPFAGETDTGLVYRFDATSGQQVVTYGNPTPTGADFFGADVDGDAGQVLIGAPLDASGGAPTGAIYLFDADAATIVHAIPNPNATDDLFGAAVALGQWIVAGAPLADDGLGAVGTVWVFDRATGNLVRRLENPSPGRFDSFGASVALLLGDRLVVGAPRADDTVLDTGLAYLFDVSDGQLLQTFRSPPQGVFDNFGFAVAAGATSVLIGSPGPGRVYVFDPIASAAGVARAVPRLLAAVTSQCGNGLVEEAEECDDGNRIDGDDCRSNCTRGLCCALDAISCDDGNPCTTDIPDDAIGCRYEAAPGCCVEDSDCGGGQCRVCVGCFLFEWDCCPRGSECIPSNPECAVETCLDRASCQCAGKLDCDGEAIPDSLKKPFDDACSILLNEANVAPDGTPVTKEEIVGVRQQTRNARASLKKTTRMARKLRRSGDITRQCRKKVAQKVRVVRTAIPRGKKLRRCLVNGS